MEHLSTAEEKIARRECLKIVGQEYPGFNPKGWSTVELATVTRMLMREASPEYDMMNNKDLMKIIIEGDESEVLNSNGS